MSRQVKRVPLGFDWPIGVIWPGYMGDLCGNMRYIAGYDVKCALCRKFAKLVGIETEDNGCPVMDIDPPPGPAYQIWETVTEGSPVSPAFTTPEELAAWMVENDTSITSGATFDDWVKFINGPGWAPSMAFDGRELKSGVEANYEDED